MVGTASRPSMAFGRGATQSRPYLVTFFGPKSNLRVQAPRRLSGAPAWPKVSVNGWNLAPTGSAAKAPNVKRERRKRPRCRMLSREVDVA